MPTFVDVGRRTLSLTMLVAAVVLLFGAVAHRSSAQLETAPPTVVPEFETPIPTNAPVFTPVVTQPLTTPLPTLPSIDVRAAAGIGVTFVLVWLLLALFFVVVSWRIFTKAGEPGWASIVPVYNAIVLLKIAGKPWWWIFIMWLVIPVFIAYVDLAHRFGKSTGFGVGLVLLSPIFFPILAFGDAQYEPAMASGT